MSRELLIATMKTAVIYELCAAFALDQPERS